MHQDRFRLRSPTALPRQSWNKSDLILRGSERCRKGRRWRKAGEGKDRKDGLEEQRRESKGRGQDPMCIV